MPLSHSPSLLIAANIFATILLSFGLNAIFRPLSALSFFELYPSTISSTHETTLINALMVVYGIRDVFMGVAIYVAAYYAKASVGGRKVLGTMLTAGSVVAFIDGAVCKWIVGEGEWGHWGYAPVMGIVGGVLMG
ncbi:hypothetical protein DL98DRAFT_503169, partial [Cadophora sp. DSE1049]